MKIKITPFDDKKSQLKIDIKISNNFYGGNSGYCGLITEVKKSDDWLDQEMAWITRSEIPLVSALRLSQVKNEYEGNLVSGLVPIIRDCGPVYMLKEINKFPSQKDCIELLSECCSLACNGSYFFQNVGCEQEIIKIFRSFDYKSNLLIRAGACLYKANILLETSFVFAEEIYIDTYIAFESLIEYLELKYKVSRNEIVKKITLMGVNNFTEYEEEMRDFIRNDIIHPYRDRYKQKIAQPFLMADYVLEDLGFVDWLFKQILFNAIK